MIEGAPYEVCLRIRGGGEWTCSPPIVGGVLNGGRWWYTYPRTSTGIEVTSEQLGPNGIEVDVRQSGLSVVRGRGPGARLIAGKALFQSGLIVPLDKNVLVKSVLVRVEPAP